MPTRSLFPTIVYSAPLQTRPAHALNTRLLAECLQLRLDDRAGQRWSKKNYAGGYTSYSSAHRMHQISPTFVDLSRKLNRHVEKFVASLSLDLSGRPLVMTDCWVNIMPFRAAHTSHLHPLSTISGTYYVQTPPGCAGLKFEDPRLDRFMAVPPSHSSARGPARGWATLPAQTGHVILFESWLRHEVAASSITEERISISFNYNWF